MIPPLGDRGVEADVQALFETHGIRARTHAYTPTRRPRVRPRPQHPLDVPEEGEEGEGEMEDDRDTNTGSTHADYEYVPVSSPRRHLGLGAGRREEEAMEVDEPEERDCLPSRPPSRSSSPGPSTHTAAHGRGLLAGGRVGSPASSAEGRSRSVVPPEMGYNDDLDLAGTCFDPSGRFLYVGSVEGVVEWSVRGAEKRWWTESGWV